MLRFLTVSVLAATLCVAGVLYKIKYDTRSLQREAVALRKQIATERQQLAVLKAEWSILTHPRRIDKLAALLGLEPLKPQQIISYRDLDALPLASGRDVGSQFAPGQASHFDESVAGEGAHKAQRVKNDLVNDFLQLNAKREEVSHDQ